MSNLGFYQTVTTIIKKSGGPKNFVGYLIMASTAALGTVGTLGYKLGQKNEKSKSIASKKRVYIVNKDDVSNEGVRFNVGDKFQVLESDGDAVLIAILNDKDNPHFVDRTLLTEISNYESNRYLCV